jgi:hypothetical protein
MNITSYNIVTAYSQDLPRMVQDLIAQGWQPYGDPFLYGGYIVQAVVQYGSSVIEEPSSMKSQMPIEDAHVEHNDEETLEGDE